MPRLASTVFPNRNSILNVLDQKEDRFHELTCKEELKTSWLLRRPSCVPLQWCSAPGSSMLEVKCC